MPKKFDWLPFVVLLFLVVLLLVLWRVFPWLEHVVFTQDCVATGRNNCG